MNGSRLFAVLFALCVSALPTQLPGDCSSSDLGLLYSNQTQITRPGDLLPLEDLTEAPTLYLSRGWDTTQTYLMLMVHPDISINGSLLDLVHWIQPNLRVLSEFQVGELTVDNSSASGETPYLPPGPPAELGVQEYFFYLFNQPLSWTFPSSFASINPPADVNARLGFDIERFLQEGNLELPLASSFIRTRNSTV